MHSHREERKYSVDLIAMMGIFFSNKNKLESINAIPSLETGYS